MPFQDQLNQLFAMRRTTRQRTLDDMRRLLGAVGNPERGYFVIQVVGTNGKGSTAAMLSSVLQKSGYRTGLFTSPHLLEFRERFQVDGTIVADRVLAPLLDRVLKVAQQEEVTPVFFDVATVMAALLFAEAKVDIAIVEAGMGARLDATSAIPADLSILTQVDADHMPWLGPELKDVARDKASTFRFGKPGVLGVKEESLVSVILEEVTRIQPSQLWRIGLDFPDLSEPQSPTTHTPEGRSTKAWYELSPGLSGTYQMHNLSLVLAAVSLLEQEGFSVPWSAIQEGIRDVRWPGRMQRLHWNDHDIWLDGAHNPSAMQAVLQDFEDKPLTLIFGAMQDKDLESVLIIVLPRVERVIFCPIQQPYAASPEDLLQTSQAICSSGVRISCVASLQEALHEATTTSLQDNEARSTVLVSGSLFLVGEVLAWWRMLDMA